MICMWCRKPVKSGVDPWEGLLLCVDCWEDHDVHAARLIAAFDLAGRLPITFKRVVSYSDVPPDVTNLAGRWERMVEDGDIDDAIGGTEPWDL